jgi:hypothetical protein
LLQRNNAALSVLVFLNVNNVALSNITFIVKVVNSDTATNRACSFSSDMGWRADMLNNLLIGSDNVIKTCSMPVGVFNKAK